MLSPSPSRSLLRSRGNADQPRHAPLAIRGRRRVQLWLLTVLWVVVLYSFWSWWLPSHEGASPTLFAINAAALAYVTTVLPSFYWFFVSRARTPVHRPAPAGLRVAVITLCVPSSESSDIVHRQLESLEALDYPCDVWLLDEGDSPELAALAARHGARHFSRRGIAEWNQPQPPFMAKTKAGNVNAWLDHVAALGIDYDVFVQFDIDHRPVPEYLSRVLGHFDDPRIGWVQAPSVSGNLEHWTARGQAEQETALQGPLQMGFYGHSGTPFIIGSHTSYRTSAIREIGGYQPTRAEDHLDTVVLAAHGYRGVYVPEVIATGDGPETFSTYLGQQFAWAYSMAQIFLTRTPRLLRHYSPRQAFQFLMAQSWYTLWSLSCLLLWALPLVSLATGRPIAIVTLSDFLVHYVPLLATATLLWWWARPLFQPRRVTLTWRWLVLEAARWPVVLLAIGNALFGVTRSYMITPKGSNADRLAPGMKLYLPFFLLAWIALAAIGVFHLTGSPLSSAGYLWLGFMNAGGALLVVLVGATIEARGVLRAHGVGMMVRERGVTLALALVTLGAMVAAIVSVADLLRLTLQ